jgi:hypothetical protein
MSAPLPSASRKRSMISTGIVRSASRKTMGSPLAASMPARTAAPFPRCGRRSALKVSPFWGSVIFARWKVAAVGSSEPSSARMISAASPRERKNSAHRARDASRRRASL